MRICALFLTLALVAAAAAGPQHFGFGFGYLVTVEEGPGGRVLSVYEPPLRVKDGAWLLRWRDASSQYAELLPDGLAIGNFWPEPMGGKEHVVGAFQGADGALTLRVLDPPEVFGTRPWKALGEWTSTPLPDDDPQRKHGDRWMPPLSLLVGGNRIVALAGGNVLGFKRDQLVVLTADSRTPPNYALHVYEAPPQIGSGEWPIKVLVSLKDVLKAGDTPLGMMVADFWGHEGGPEKDLDVVALALRDRVVYFGLEDTGRRSPTGRTTGGTSFAVFRPKVLAEHKLIEPLAEADWLVGCDFLKDGFAYWARGGRAAAPGTFTLGTAPRTAERFHTAWVRPDETFAGAKLTGQAPGEARTLMHAARQAPTGSVVAAAGGRIFGYIVASAEQRKEMLWKPWSFVGHDDVEIAFAHRTPVYRLGVPKKWQDGDWPWEPDDHFGWPLKDEVVTYEVSLKNNGKETIPAGRITVRAWVSTPDRNADLLAPERPDFTFTLDRPLAPFDPAKPEYAVVKIALPWPFDLVQPPGWTWKRINVREIGERWLIVQADYAADVNVRNNRYELALNALLFRPVLRYDVDAPPHPTPEGLEGKPERKINTLAWRAPVVVGDPESKEYSARKLADAVTCMWERSRTSDGQDVWQRYVFDSYRLYDPQGRDGLRPLNRADDWSYYEAPRENEHWLGLWGDYERFDPADGGAELHETGHLGHRIGDLYHYFVNPIGLGAIRMGDGRPVQMHTYAWGLDSYCSGHAILGEATCDLHHYIEGIRYGLGWPWHRMLPDRIRVRVLDRDGEPVAGAAVALWLHPENQVHSRGTTDAEGLWDPQFPGAAGAGEAAFDLFEPLNIKLWKGRALDALAQVLVVDLPDYSDFMIWGAEDTHAHSRYTLMHESLRNRASWTWDFRTLYKAGAPAPDFEVTAAVQGRTITLSMPASPGGRYRIYRRWEPTYVFEPLGEVPAPADGATVATFADDMGAPDWYMKGRFRAVYYVTRVTERGESLPRCVYGIAIDAACGLSDAGDGRLVLALNCGRAEPFGVLCQGTTPLQEYVKHFRFGHTAAKIVPSEVHPRRLYATLLSSDMPWGVDRYFDLIQFDRPDRHQPHYAVPQTLADCDVAAFTTAPPYTLTLRPDGEARAAVNPGDWVLAGDDGRARVLAVDPPAGDLRAPAGVVVTVDRPLFRAGQLDGLHVRVEFGGGTPGERAELRELRKPRGLAVVRLDDAMPGGAAGDAATERFALAIADTGNGRVVVWDTRTRYLAQWSGEDGFHPCAVARHPTARGQFFVLDRRADRQSRIYLLALDGAAVQVVSSQPVDVGDGPEGVEIGLAAAAGPDGVRLAVTDAAQQRVLVLPYSPDANSATVTLNRAVGTFAGKPELTNPTDVAFSVEDGQLRLYAVDGRNRVVRLQ